MINGDQFCDAASSPVSRYFFVSIQPTTGARAPPAENHSVLFLSSAKTRWCVVKHVSMCTSLPVFGSYIETWRGACVVGNSFADGWLDPARQNAGVSGGRIRAVIHTRPSWSSIGLCTDVWLLQSFSSPQ